VKKLLSILVCIVAFSGCRQTTGENGSNNSGTAGSSALGLSEIALNTVVTRATPTPNPAVSDCNTIQADCVTAGWPANYSFCGYSCLGWVEGNGPTTCNYGGNTFSIPSKSTGITGLPTVAAATITACKQEQAAAAAASQSSAAAAAAAFEQECLQQYACEVIVRACENSDPQESAHDCFNYIAGLGTSSGRSYAGNLASGIIPEVITACKTQIAAGFVNILPSSASERCPAYPVDLQYLSHLFH